jgi:sugar-specific transcriptional regulator TrmB
MAIREEDAQTLVGLGLTALQAKVYLALAKTGDATIKTISVISKVARQDIYRVIVELHDLGLVEKLIDAPTKFRAIPIKECVFILLRNRVEKTSELQQEASELILHFSKDKTVETELKEEESQFVIINELQARRLKSKKELDKVQKNVKIVTKWSIFSPLIFALGEEINKTVERGVRFQIVVGRSKSERETQLPEHIRALEGNPLFTIRYIHNVQESAFAIYDGKELILTISKSTEQLPEAPVLSTNNRSLIELAEHYFKMMWDASRQGNVEKHERRRASEKPIDQPPIRKN